MTRPQSNLRIIAALMAVAENVVFKAHCVLDDGSMKTRLAKLHQEVLEFQREVVGQIDGRD